MGLPGALRPRRQPNPRPNRMRDSLKEVAESSVQARITRKPAPRRPAGGRARLQRLATLLRHTLALPPGGVPLPLAPGALRRQPQSRSHTLPLLCSRRRVLEDDRVSRSPELNRVQRTAAHQLGELAAQLFALALERQLVREGAPLVLRNRGIRLDPRQARHQIIALALPQRAGPAACTTTPSLGLILRCAPEFHTIY